MKHQLTVEACAEVTCTTGLQVYSWDCLAREQAATKQHLAGVPRSAKLCAPLPSQQCSFHPWMNRKTAALPSEVTREWGLKLKPLWVLSCAWRWSETLAHFRGC